MAQLRVGSTFVLAFLVLTLGGCEEPTTATVTGKVMVNGEPAEMGSITFIPVDGLSSTAGTKIENGEYTAQVPFGQVQIQVRVSEVVGQVKIYDTPDSPVQDKLAEVLPPKYNNETELVMNVEPGENVKDFDFEVKRRKRN